MAAMASVMLDAAAKRSGHCVTGSVQRTWPPSPSHFGSRGRLRDQQHASACRRQPTCRLVPPGGDDGLACRAVRHGCHGEALVASEARCLVGVGVKGVKGCGHVASRVGGETDRPSHPAHSRSLGIIGGDADALPPDATLVRMVSNPSSCKAVVGRAHIVSFTQVGCVVSLAAISAVSSG